MEANEVSLQSTCGDTWEPFNNLEQSLITSAGILLVFDFGIQNRKVSTLSLGPNNSNCSELVGGKGSLDVL